MEEMAPQNTSSTSAYNKRPLWQWILLYVVLAAIIYGTIYYFFFAKKGGYNYSANQAAVSPKVSQAVSPTVVVTSILLTKINPAHGPYLTDNKGMTLYIFDKDTVGVSNCTGGCLTAWPAFVPDKNAPSTLPANLTTIKRPDRSLQYAYKGMPLYYYFKDTKPGDVTGDGVGGTWHLVKP